MAGERSYDRVITGVQPDFERQCPELVCVAHRGAAPRRARVDEGDVRQVARDGDVGHSGEECSKVGFDLTLVFGRDVRALLLEVALKAVDGLAVELELRGAERHVLQSVYRPGQLVGALEERVRLLVARAVGVLKVRDAARHALFRQVGVGRRGGGRWDGLATLGEGRLGKRERGRNREARGENAG